MRTGTLLTAEHRLHLCSLLALHSLHLQEGDFKMQTFCNLQINSRQGPPCCGLSHIFPPHLSVCFHPARPLSVPQMPPIPPCSHLQTTLHAARTLLLHPLLLGAFFRFRISVTSRNCLCKVRSHGTVILPYLSTHDILLESFVAFSDFLTRQTLPCEGEAHTGLFHLDLQWKAECLQKVDTDK